MSGGITEGSIYVSGLKRLGMENVRSCKINTELYAGGKSPEGSSVLYNAKGLTRGDEYSKASEKNIAP